MSAENVNLLSSVSAYIILMKENVEASIPDIIKIDVYSHILVYSPEFDYCDSRHIRFLNDELYSLEIQTEGIFKKEIFYTDFQTPIYSDKIRHWYFITDFTDEEIVEFFPLLNGDLKFLKKNRHIISCRIHNAKRN